MASVKNPSVRNPSVRAPSVKAPSVVPGGYDEHEAGLNDKLDRLSVADRKSIAPAETDLPNGDANVASGEYATEEPNLRSNESDTMALGTALATDPRELEHETEPEAITEPNGGYQEGAIPTLTGETDTRSIAAGTNREYDAKSVATGTTRLTQHEEPSRSYLPVDNQSETIDRAPIAVVTNWEDEDPAQKRRSVTGSKAPSVRRQSTDAGSLRAQSVKAASVRPPSRTGNRPASVAGSRRNTEGIIAGAVGGAAVGEVMSPQRQRDLQQRNQDSGISLNDQGAIPRDRSTTFNDSNAQRSASPRPMSPFGHRPQPNLMTVTEDGRESRYEGRDSRSAAMLGRSGTVLSRANTLGRNGTLSRAANGGTVGSRRGAFGRGAGTTIGTQPEEVLGRDDIHTRAEVSERILDEATLRRLSTMEKKDAARLAKVIKQEGKAEAAAVKGSIKELEALVKLQKEAAYTERKSQLRLSKWTTKEHRARLRFLKEKERYERIEGELRNAENDYEERRDHAGGLTAQVAEKTQELDDLRGQKAADDREREVKLLALKNPAHS